MDRHGDGNGWKFGLCFISFGLIGVLSMGVFSLLYHKGIIGSYINFIPVETNSFPQVSHCVLIQSPHQKMESSCSLQNLMVQYLRETSQNMCARMATKV